MEPDDLGLGSYYHHHHPQPSQPQPHPHHPHHQQPPPPSTINNGMLPTTTNDPRPSQLLYPHSSAPSAVSSPLETGVRRKRGRPRKYGTPEQAAAAKRLSSSSSPSTNVPPLTPPGKKELSLGVSGSSTTSFKKYAQGNTGQGFTPHVISVAAGEDISQKIMSFMQQSKQEMCVLSALGSISNASLRQPATSGGNITYEGRFDILSFCGSYIRTELGGTGGLSVCLSSSDGQIIGGGVDGPLIAAGPVQVIVGSFSIESKKESAAVIKTDATANKLPSPNVGPSVSNLSFLSGPDPSGRNVVAGGDEQQNVDGYQFMIQNRNVGVSDWRTNNDSRNTSGYDFSGNYYYYYLHDK
ncbi:AT-hook motif nuclear-localized protein 14-like [Bidens hawaiensis]|uniref:AT-hook motif nuclear-localized protein 14-like n=1 Tax=Bidens hawaiensis TaxID=980011 RepID=UPI00404B1FDD